MGPMHRRTVLRTVGGAVAGSSLFGGTVSAGGERRLPPNVHVPSSGVHPFSNVPGVEAPVVSTGEWIPHRIGWVDDPSGGLEREDVARFMDAVTVHAEIDGESVEDADQYWGEIQPYEDDNYVVWWRYSTPPKRPGTHTFSFTFEFVEEYRDQGTDGEGRYHEEGETVAVSGEYRVERRSGHQ